MLIDAGADINSVDHDGNSVFHETITKGWRWARYHTEALIELNVPLHIPNYQGRTALHLAATVDDDRGRETTRKGRVTRLEFLLHPQLKFDINAKDHQGVTPLHLAAATSDINTRQLISHGADIHAKTIQGRTPLHYAAKAGQPNSVGILQEAYRSRSLLLDDLSVECRTALHEAARSGRYESVKLLLDAGSQPDIRDGRGRTPLHAAAEFDQVPYFRRRRAYDSTEKQARKRSEEINEKLGRSGLIIDSEEDSLSAREVVRLLLAAGVDPVQRDNDNKTALDVALILGLSDVVDELAPVLAGIYASVENSPILEPIGETLSSSTRVDLGNLLRTMPASAYNDAILKRVVSTGNVKLIEQLLHSSRANLTEKDRVSALHLCARWGLLSMAKSMLPYVQNLQDLLPSLLDSATKRSLCNIEMVKLLIQSVVHATANGKQFNSSDALHRLAWGRYWWHPRALTILLESGADTELLDRGSTPLQTSLRAGAPHVSDIGLWCDETFGILIRFGADVNSSSGKSETSPLQDALESKRDLSLVQKLLDGGASVEGNQAIASAIKAENTAALELLLKSGADPNVLYTIKEPYGEHQQETPLKHASGKNEEAMELLLAHGANPHQPLHDGASSVLHDICSLNRRLNPIISAGYDLEKRDSQGRTPLLRACNLRGSDWHLARSRWDSTCSATELLHAGVDVTAVDDSGSTALHYAICSSMDKVVDELLRRGASSVARNKHGLTPIHCVLVGRTHLSKISSYHDYLPSPPLIRRLLAAGADPLDPLPDGQTALHCLIPALMDSSGEGRDSSFSSNEPDNTNSFLEHLTLYQTLTNAGCNREARDNEGNTPIFAYVRRAREYHSDVETRIPPDVNDLRRMFAEHDIHAVNNAGDTLLHAVAGREDDWDGLQDDDVLIFKLLVELGLDPKKENKDGATALDVAAAWERDEILGLFARDE